MEQTENEQYYNIASITKIIKGFFSYLKSKIAFVAISVVLFAGLGVVYYYIQKPQYTATSSFILEEKSGSLGGGLAGLVSQFGVDIGGMGGGSIFAGDNILDILKSRLIVEKVLLSKIKEDDSTTTTLIDLYLDFCGYKNKWKNNEKLEDITFNNINTRSELSRIQDSLLSMVYIAISKKYLAVDRLNKKGSIFSVEVTSVNQIFSKYMVDRLVTESRNLYINIKTNTAQANITRLEAKSDSLLQLLNSSSYQTAKLQILDLNPAIKEAGVPVELAQRNKSVVAAIYTEVVRNLEASKISLTQQTPVIQVLDSPSFPLANNKKGRLMLAFVGAFLGFIISCSFFFYRYLNLNKSGSNT